MLPDPLHPAVVHFPIVLMYIAPLVTAFVLSRMKRSESSARMWLVIPILLAVVAVSGFAAQQSGEAGEDLAERLVDHDTIERHEEQANLFVWFTVASVVVAVAAFAAGPVGSFLRVLTLILTVVGAVLVTRTGHSGGTMVYDHMIASTPAESVNRADIDD
ncbi:MAG: hypothetical protein HKN17_04795 [Rhodothermales bacterium]|nr:hypothetical protein [Rhodothermales bacterium]